MLCLAQATKPELRFWPQSSMKQWFTKYLLCGQEWDPFRVSTSVSAELCQHHPSPCHVWFASEKHSTSRWITKTASYQVWSQIFYCQTWAQPEFLYKTTAAPDNMAPSPRSGPAAGGPGRCWDGGTLGSWDPHVYRPSLVLLQCLLLELYLKTWTTNFRWCHDDKWTIKQGSKEGWIYSDNRWQLN